MTAVAQSSPMRIVCRNRMGGAPSAFASMGTLTLRPSNTSLTLFSRSFSRSLCSPTAPATSASASRKLQRGIVAGPLWGRLPGARVAE